MLILINVEKSSKNKSYERVRCSADRYIKKLLKKEFVIDCDAYEDKCVFKLKDRTIYLFEQNNKDKNFQFFVTDDNCILLNKNISDTAFELLKEKTNENGFFVK